MFDFLLFAPCREVSVSVRLQVYFTVQLLVLQLFIVPFVFTGVLPRQYLTIALVVSLITFRTNIYALPSGSFRLKVYSFLAHFFISSSVEVFFGDFTLDNRKIKD